MLAIHVVVTVSEQDRGVRTLGRLGSAYNFKTICGCRLWEKLETGMGLLHADALPSCPH